MAYWIYGGNGRYFITMNQLTPHKESPNYLEFRNPGWLGVLTLGFLSHRLKIRIKSGWGLESRGWPIFGNRKKFRLDQVTGLYFEEAQSDEGEERQWRVFLGLEGQDTPTQLCKAPNLRYMEERAEGWAKKLRVPLTDLTGEDLIEISWEDLVKSGFRSQVSQAKGSRARAKSSQGVFEYQRNLPPNPKEIRVHHIHKGLVIDLPEHGMSGLGLFWASLGIGLLLLALASLYMAILSPQSALQMGVPHTPMGYLAVAVLGALSGVGLVLGALVGAYGNERIILSRSRLYDQFIFAGLSLRDRVVPLSDINEIDSLNRDKGSEGELLVRYSSGQIVVGRRLMPESQKWLQSTLRESFKAKQSA